jgi:hypothetical protein
MSDLQMQKDELLALPVSVDLATAGRAFGLGRTRSYELARAGEFPCRVIPVGRKFRVPRSALLEALGIKDNTADPEPATLCLAHALGEALRLLLARQRRSSGRV